MRLKPAIHKITYLLFTLCHCASSHYMSLIHAPPTTSLMLLPPPHSCSSHHLTHAPPTTSLMLLPLPHSCSSHYMSLIHAPPTTSLMLLPLPHSCSSHHMPLPLINLSALISTSGGHSNAVQTCSYEVSRGRWKGMEPALGGDIMSPLLLPLLPLPLKDGVIQRHKWLELSDESVKVVFKNL